MARPIWTGSLSFGLVNVPVGLYSATEDRTVRFHQFQAGTSDRVRNKRVNERTGEEVDFGEVVKGYETDEGELVFVTPQELDGLEPDRSTNIEISDFIDLGDIDPIYFQKSYYLAPQGDQAKRAYALLRHAMLETNRVGVATFVMRGKEYLVAVRPEEDVLLLETMFFSDEVRDPREEIDSLGDEVTFKGRELDTAKLLIDSMVAQWEPDKYRDTFRERVLDLIERKLQGEEVVIQPAAKKPARVADLMEALERSVQAAKKRHGQKTSAARSDGARSRAEKAASSPAKAPGARKVKSEGAKQAPDRRRRAS